MPKKLVQKHCVPCASSMSPLAGEKLDKYRALLNDEWRFIGHNKKITREFKFDGFKTAMQFVNGVANLAEEEGHHPDIYIFYSKVVLTLWTHAIGGLSENDFIMATKIDLL